MEWISSSTAPEAIFAGSMQLMAGVKACTSRPISNHPHFEDKNLRQKTERIYKIYGKYSISNVHKMACSESINYLILEDSICFAPKKDGCSTNEIIDNSQFFQSTTKNNNNIISPTKDRFCQAVKVQQINEKIVKKFKLVFENQTFKIYRVFC
uniref:Uncharacterized protein n=1 Tax=Panagrolaimus superbus TaxID=310955 RepID=A0A914YTD4_9BILA